MSENELWYTSLPDSVQSLIEVMHSELNDELRDVLQNCASPIEQQFVIGLTHHLHSGDSAIWFEQQQAIRAGGVDYKVDFLLTTYDMIFEGDMPVLDWETSIAVECDGWNWHSSKQQIAHDNKRDQDLLLYHNIPTIRFTGSEIFNDPIGCAGKALRVLKRVNQHNHENNLLLLKGHHLASGKTKDEQAEG